VIYAVVLREHPTIVKLGRSTRWKNRRKNYDNWNHAPGTGIAAGRVYTLNDEFVDLTAVEGACLEAMTLRFPLFRGNEWFRASLEEAQRTIEGILSDGALAYIGDDI
jgi:hypothetical protein